MSTKSLRTFVLLLALCLQLPLTACCPKGSAAPGPGTSAIQAGAATADEAKQLLGETVRRIHSTGAFTVDAETTFEEVAPNGARTTSPVTRVRYLVQKPDKLRAKIESSDRDREYWYDGKKFTAADRTNKLVVQDTLGVPLSQLRTTMMERFGISLPLGQLIAEESLEELQQRVTAARVVGDSEAAGSKCTELAFEEPHVDWSVCIGSDGDRLPRRLVVTYKTEPGQPQFSANFNSWNLSPTVKSASFEAPRVPAPGTPRS